MKNTSNKDIRAKNGIDQFYVLYTKYGTHLKILFSFLDLSYSRNCQKDSE